MFVDGAKNSERAIDRESFQWTNEEIRWGTKS